MMEGGGKETEQDFISHSCTIQTISAKTVHDNVFHVILIPENDLGRTVRGKRAGQF